MKAIFRQYVYPMSIITRTGDDGDTGLWSGERIGKDDVRVEAYGTIDELSSALGVARHLCFQDEVLYAIEDIQRLLFRVAGELASVSIPFDRPILPKDEETIAEKTASLEERIVLSGFVIPGMTAGSAALDVARTIARRAERRVVQLSRKDDVSIDLRKFLNRLSDYLFMLARAEESAAGKLTFA
ncbi:MAG TPA: cob(I)yrinic acid a,c-diamide adenosyltransferase [Rectinemataceae bacterium]|nr:cob(I)yrinic acid a,c-diamide adenosyltransferase [Rectinemataceae bacterium]